MPSRRHLTALAVLSLGGLLLTGCASSNASDSANSSDSAGSQESASQDSGASMDQSVAEACADLSSTISSSASALQDGMSEFANDPQLAVDSLTAFADEFDAARDEVGNAEVREQADAASVALDEMIVALEAGVADPANFDVSAFTETASNVQTELAAIGDVCTN